MLGRTCRPPVDARYGTRALHVIIPMEPLPTSKQAVGSRTRHQCRRQEPAHHIQACGHWAPNGGAACPRPVSVATMTVARMEVHRTRLAGPVGAPQRHRAPYRVPNPWSRRSSLSSKRFLIVSLAFQCRAATAARQRNVERQIDRTASDGHGRTHGHASLQTIGVTILPETRNPTGNWKLATRRARLRPTHARYNSKVE